MVSGRLHYRKVSGTVQKLVLFSSGDEHGSRGAGAIPNGSGVCHPFRRGWAADAQILGKRDRIQRWGGKDGGGGDALALLYSRSGDQHQFWLRSRREDPPPFFPDFLECLQVFWGLRAGGW